MKLRNFLQDTLKQCTFPKIKLDILSIEPTSDDKVSIKAFDEDRMFIIDAITHESVDSVDGHFGLSNFRMLKGLVESPSFSDDNSIALGSRKIDGKDVPDRISFKGKGTKATFRLINKEVIPAQPTINNVPWDIEFVPVSEKISEFNQMANLYSEIDENFTLTTKDNKLIASFGVVSSSTHSGEMVLDDNVSEFPGDLVFAIDKFQMMIKACSNDYSVKITSKGILGVFTETPTTNYSYYLKKKMV